MNDHLVETFLHTFNGAEVKPLRVITLLVDATDRILKVKFLVVDTLLAMNVIMGKEWIHAVKSIV